MKGKMVNGCAGPKQTISKERALEAFRKISDMTAVLSMRCDRERIVSNARKEGNEALAKWYLESWQPDKYSGTNDEELKAIINNEHAAYKTFWGARLSNIPFFAEDCGWDIPGCEGLVILRRGRKPIVLIEKTVEMLMFLSESPPTIGDETTRTWGIRTNFGFDAFTDYPVMLQTALHPDVRKYLISTLDTDQLVAMIHIVSNGNTKFDCRDIYQIVKALGEREIELLAEYCVTSDSGVYSIIPPIREHGGEEGKTVIEQIIGHMERISRYFERKLKFLKGENYDEEKD